MLPDLVACGFLRIMVADATPSRHWMRSPFRSVRFVCRPTFNLNTCLGGRVKDRPQGSRAGSMSWPQDVFGADIAKGWIDTFTLSSRKHDWIAIRKPAPAQFVRGAVGCLVVCEASGCDARPLIAALAAAGTDCARVPPVPPGGLARRRSRPPFATVSRPSGHRPRSAWDRFVLGKGCSDHNLICSTKRISRARSRNITKLITDQALRTSYSFGADTVRTVRCKRCAQK
jgi:hypothetical protein